MAACRMASAVVSKSLFVSYVITTAGRLASVVDTVAIAGRLASVAVGSLLVVVVVGSLVLGFVLPEVGML